MSVGLDKFAYLKELRGRKFPKGDGAYRVLVEVWNYTDEHGSNAYPGIPRLASDCCMGESTVRRHLKWLVANGYLIQESRGHRAGDVKLASVYSLAIPDLTLATERKNEPEQSYSTAQVDTSTAHLEQFYRSPGTPLPLTAERPSDHRTNQYSSDQKTDHGEFLSMAEWNQRQQQQDGRQCHAETCQQYPIPNGRYCFRHLNLSAVSV